MTRLIFLDLDKTLLGEDYDIKPAVPYLEKLKDIGFKIVFNSSKTFFEQKYYIETLGFDAIMITENGSGIYVPLSDPISRMLKQNRHGYAFLKYGLEYALIKQYLDSIATDYCLKYYGNSTISEIMGFTGLTDELARLATQREFSETIFEYCSDGFKPKLETLGLKVTKGSRFYTVTGQTDKGVAARKVIELHRLYGKVFSVAVGDGENDIPMFEVVDLAIVIGTLDYKKAVHFTQITNVVDFIIHQEN
jgi:mannosyl-3-phosphoglycerate phosphatase